MVNFDTGSYRQGYLTGRQMREDWQANERTAAYEGALTGLKSDDPNQKRQTWEKLNRLDPERTQKMYAGEQQMDAQRKAQLGVAAQQGLQAIQNGQAAPRTVLNNVSQVAAQAGYSPGEIAEVRQQVEQNPQLVGVVLKNLVAEGMGAYNYLQEQMARGKEERGYTQQRGLQEMRGEQAMERQEVAGEQAMERQGLAGEQAMERTQATVAGKRGPIRDQKIASVMQQYGTDAQTAAAIVDGNYVVQTDPLSGETFVINKVTGERGAPMAQQPPGGQAPPPSSAPPPPAGAPAPPSGAAPPPAGASGAAVTTPEGEPTIFDMLGQGVGFIPVAQEGLAVTAGQVSDDFTNPEVTQVRTRLRGLRERLITALSQGGRVSNQEQTRILENLPSLGIFESESHARAQLTELHGRLSRQMMDDLSVYNDSTAPKKARQEAYEGAQAIGQILREMGTPPADGPTMISTQEEYDQLPSGAEYIDKDSGKRGRKP